MVLDKYEVLQKLGEGATATVYRGRHSTIGKDVAIKILHPHLSASSRYRERFNREAKAVGRLSHQNIVSILDYSGQNAEECYIVTELIEGQTLQSLLQQRGRLPSEIAVLVGMELAAALGFAHSQGVVHRDLKPENIMIRRDGRVKLMDFGVARVLDECTITLEGSLLGSPAYMSPQQALDAPLDGRSDLFSLGTVLFHMVTGHVPFAGSNPSVILRNIIEGNRPEVMELAADTAPGLVGVIDRLMQAQPDDRYPRAEEAQEALGGCLADVGLIADHPIINLRNYLLEPDDTTLALQNHLKTVLLAKGRERLNERDHLGALQLLNRLLAIGEAQNEENQEVLALIQSLHQLPEPRPRPWKAAAGAAFGVIAMAALAWWMYPDAPVRAPGLAGTAISGTGTAGTGTAGAGTAGAGTAGAGTAGAGTAISGTAISGTAISGTAISGTAIAAIPGAAIPGTAIPAIPGTTPKGTPRGSTLQPTTAPRPPLPSLTAPATGPGWLTLTSPSWAEVWLDGRRLGTYRKGPSSEWVASPQNPLAVEAGEHTLMLRNDHSEPKEVRFTIEPGQKKLIQMELERKPVHLTVNPMLPRDCAVTIGSTHYDSVRDFNGSLSLKSPAPDLQVTFDCPAPIGRLRSTIGPTDGGETIILPTSIPAVAGGQP